MLVCSVQIISRLDGQSKFQMFTPFSGRHVGVPQRYTNMAASYWALSILQQEGKITNVKRTCNKLEQYLRWECLEFHGIPLRGGRKGLR